MSKTVQMDVKLPREIVEALSIIAKRAGVSVATVIKVALATESLKWTQATQP